MGKKRTRSMSNLNSDGGASGNDSTPSRLRRITSLSGWPRSRIPKESEGHSAATGEEGVDLPRNSGRISSRSELRSIASTSSRIFRANIGAGPIQDTETMAEDKMKGKLVTRRPSVVHLRRIASMPGRSLKRMASRSFVPSQDAAVSEGRRLSRMKSWSDSMRSGSSRWFGLGLRKEPGLSRVEESETPSQGTRPVRRVHFATAELRPDFGSESSEDDNFSSYHVSLLPSRRHVEEIRDGGDKREKWWRNDEYYAALAIPIF